MSTKELEIKMKFIIRFSRLSAGYSSADQKCKVGLLFFMPIFQIRNYFRKLDILLCKHYEEMK